MKLSRQTNVGAGKGYENIQEKEEKNAEKSTPQLKN